MENSNGQDLSDKVKVPCVECGEVFCINEMIAEKGHTVSKYDGSGGYYQQILYKTPCHPKLVRACDTGNGTIVLIRYREDDIKTA